MLPTELDSEIVNVPEDAAAIIENIQFPTKELAEEEHTIGVCEYVFP